MKKYKVFSLLFILIFTFFICNLTIDASIKAKITGTGVQIRKGAGTTYSSIASLSKNSIVYLNSTTLYADDKNGDCSSKWYQITYNSATRYICSKYVSIVTSNATYNTEDYTSRIYASSVNIRKSASSSSTALTSLIAGTNTTIKATKASGNGCSTNWYQISYHNNSTGYVCGTYLRKKSDLIASDVTIEAELKAAGFPDSYLPYLVKLKKQHPSWKFEAQKTKLNFDAVVDGESERNKINKQITAYITSSTPSEGTSWYTSTDGVNAFFLDPRNFLTEKFIFMFISARYNSDLESKYSSLVKNTFSSCSSSTSFKDNLYVNALVNAGKNNGVSPEHLAARLKQEVGSCVGTSGATTGGKFTYNGKTYSGYYNFFNIGAYGSNPMTRGLAYAAGLLNNTAYGVPWNSVEKAINGGGAFIYKGYVNAGQDTLYYQKFDVSPNSESRYTNQYMTNVMAPVNEGSTEFSVYSGLSLLNEPLSFIIPIYENMPAVTSLPSLGNSNTNLTGITVDGSSVSGFDKDVIEYDYYVLDSTSSVKINATAEASTSTITGIDTYSLTDDDTIIALVVTSQTGTSKTYEIAIHKVSEVTNTEEIIKSAGYSLSDHIIKGISNKTKVSTLSTKILTFSPNAVLTFTNASNATLGTTTYLATGNILSIKTATGSTSYTFSVKGDTSGDGEISILDLLQVQKHLLRSKTLKNANFIAADTSDDNEVTILDLLQIQKHLLGSKIIK